MQWRLEGREGVGRTRRRFAGAALDGRKFGILAFALQCVSVSLFSALRMAVAGWRGSTTDLCPGRQKNPAPYTATGCTYNASAAYSITNE